MGQPLFNSPKATEASLPSDVALQPEPALETTHPVSTSVRRAHQPILGWPPSPPSQLRRRFPSHRSSTLDAVDQSTVPVSDVRHEPMSLDDPIIDNNGELIVPWSPTDFYNREPSNYNHQPTFTQSRHARGQSGARSLRNIPRHEQRLRNLQSRSNRSRQDRNDDDQHLWLDGSSGEDREMLRTDPYNNPRSYRQVARRFSPGYITPQQRSRAAVPSRGASHRRIGTARRPAFERLTFEQVQQQQWPSGEENSTASDDRDSRTMPGVTVTSTMSHRISRRNSPFTTGQDVPAGLVASQSPQIVINNQPQPDENITNDYGVAVPSTGGLGDRERSMSAGSPEGWTTLSNTLEPDPQPLSVQSSFAPTRVSTPATTQNTSDDTQIDRSEVNMIMNSLQESAIVGDLMLPTDPTREPPRRGQTRRNYTQHIHNFTRWRAAMDRFQAEAAAEAAAEESNPSPLQTLLPDEASMAEEYRLLTRTPPPLPDFPPPRPELPSVVEVGDIAADPQLFTRHWTGLLRIVCNLAQQEEIPDVWWSLAGLDRMT